MLRLAVFDLDGTLLDTAGDICAAVNKALKGQGLPPKSTGEVRGMVGNGVSALAESALAGRGNKDRFVSDYRAAYSEGLLKTTRPYGGIGEILAKMKKAGIRLAVLSNKPQEDTERLIEAFFPGAFGAVWGQREGIPKKPDPHMLHKAQEVFSAGSGECVLIGDSETDARTAFAADWRFAGVLWGFRTREELIAAGAETLAASPEELAELIGIY